MRESGSWPAKRATSLGRPLAVQPDFPADLFAVGLVALYLLEGAKPDAKALIEHFAAHGTPKAPRGIPEPLWQVIATLHELSEEALIDILTKPKNSLVKQFQKMFEMDGVKLKFTKGALQAIAREALTRESGARGLRAIMEEAMLDVMYDVPSKQGIKEVVVNEDAVNKGKELFEENKDKIAEAVKSEQAEDISDKVLDGVADFAKKIAPGAADTIDDIRANADKAVGNE